MEEGTLTVLESNFTFPEENTKQVSVSEAYILQTVVITQNTVGAAKYV